MITISGIQYNVGERYELKKFLGAGAYGHVVLALDKKNNSN
jgi:mitogen-activated protein kinase 1/3